MSRPAEAAYRAGTPEQFEAFVRGEFPQCIKRDENGDEMVPVQYQSYYNHEVGCEYFPAMVIDDSDPDSANWPTSQALMVDWHVEPESRDQTQRIVTRAVMREILSRPDDTTRRNLRTAQRALEQLRNTTYPGVEAFTPPVNAWAPPPNPDPA